MKQLLWLLMLLPLLAEAEGPVWKIFHNDRLTGYLAGTMHVVKPEDYPLPGAFEKAYQQAEVLVFETDLYAMQDEEFARRLQAKGLYPQGQTLQDKLQPEVYRQLADYAKRRGFSLESIQQMKAGLLVANITIHELARLGVSATGVDLFFLQKAMIDQKPVYSLETLNEQIRLVVDMGEGQESRLIQQTLDELALLGEQVDELRKAWRSGDLDSLQTLWLDELQKQSPDIYDQVLTERNRKWLPALLDELEQERITLILVGAAHLPGKKGLLTLLSEAGFKVKQF